MGGKAEEWRQEVFWSAAEMGLNLGSVHYDLNLDQTYIYYRLLFDLKRYVTITISTFVTMINYNITRHI